MYSRSCCSLRLHELRLHESLYSSVTGINPVYLHRNHQVLHLAIALSILRCKSITMLVASVPSHQNPIASLIPYC